MGDSDSDHHHVKFDEEDNTFAKNNNIGVQKLSSNSLQIHLGFLKLNHTYEVIVPLHIPEHTSRDINWVPNTSAPSPFSSLKKYERVGDKGTMLIIFKAGKSKLMKDNLKLHSDSHPSVELNLQLVARVLGKGQGTPMLKDGIHSIAVEVDEESESSDWQGFE